MAVTRDDNCAFDGDSHAIEFFVVVAQTVVDVDQGAGDVAITGVGVVRWELLILLRRSWIYGDRRLLQLGGETGWRDELEEALLGRGKKNAEVLDVRVPSPLLEFGKNPFRILLVVGRTDVMRARAEQLHALAQHVGIGNGAEFFFPAALSLRIGSGEAGERRGLVGCGGGENKSGE